MLPFDDTELALVGVVVSCVVIVAAVEVVDASVELVLYVKLAKICVMVVARTKIVVIWETNQNERNQV